MIPQANPHASYLAHKFEIDAAIQRVMDSGRYILSEECAAFEREFAAWLGASHAIGCASGTDALVLALKACNVREGDLVATVSHTAVATVAAIESIGAQPLLLDVDERYGMDADELAAVISSNEPIAAVVAVHLYGQPANIQKIAGLCRHIPLIEDCAQAHGAATGCQRVGLFGDIGAFSFYPTKALGAFGDGGAVVTNDAALADKVRALRQYGWRQHYISETHGINSRLDELQAAILRAKLPHLARNNARRFWIASQYDAALQNTAITPPPRIPDTFPVFHQYVVRSTERDAVQERLREAGIGTGIHYPVPVHLQPAYHQEGLTMGPNGCRNTEILANEILSLPMYPELTDTEVERICEVLRQL